MSKPFRFLESKTRATINRHIKNIKNQFLLFQTFPKDIIALFYYYRKEYKKLIYDATAKSCYGYEEMLKFLSRKT